MEYTVFILFVCLIGITYGKISKYNDTLKRFKRIGSNELKGYYDVQMEHENEKSFRQFSTGDPNLLNNDFDMDHGRFARHVEVAVTESIINHLMKKLKQRYPQAKKQPKSLNKMMKNLKQRLNKYIHRKKPTRMRPTGNNKNIRKKTKGKKVKKVRKSKKVKTVQRRKPKRINPNVF